MKILHWAFIFIAIILPVSIVCRITINSRFAALKDEVRINNAIDTATKDAIDQIIAVSGFEYDNEFGNVIDITPALAQETINTFFNTLALNYNMPFQPKDNTKVTETSAESDIKTYFSQYVPAVLVIAYDGFYIYSEENNGSGFGYQLSSKIPYTATKTVNGKTYTVGYTLGDDIYFYIDQKCYSGKMNYNSITEISTEFNKNYAGLDVDQIAAITNDISMILYHTYKNKRKMCW